MKLFLDDERVPSNVYFQDDTPWTVVRTVAEARKAFLANPVSVMSLDHDLGDYQETGYDFLLWVIQGALNGTWQMPHQVLVHSQNPVGRKQIYQLLDSYRRNKHRWQGDAALEIQDAHTLDLEKKGPF